MKVYTKTGDKGSTALLGGTRVPKNHLKLDAYGTVDELNSWVGMIRSGLQPFVAQPWAQEIGSQLESVQKDLFLLGSHIACATEEHRQKFKLPSFNEEKAKVLENYIDQMDAQLEPLKNFILPSGHNAASSAHMARTVCRRAERLIFSIADHHAHWMTYINRLSDYFFVLARYINMKTETKETLWTME